MGTDGPANATLQLVAQGEEEASATIDAAPQPFAFKRFSQGRGFIRRGGSPLAGVTGGSLSFSNNLERVRTIRDDGRIEAAEPTLATCTGGISLRFDGATLLAEAATARRWPSRTASPCPRAGRSASNSPVVFLPKPKYAISGPGGVEASFDWRAAYDEASGTMLRVRLLNDVAGYE
jgi:hypothetical protein